MAAAVSISGLFKSYNGLVALNDVSLEIGEGEFFGLLGPNGAGKSTLISCLAGLAKPSGGCIRVMGHEVGEDYLTTRRLLGIVPQELVCDPFFTVRESLRIQSGYFGLGNNDDWIDELLHHLELTAKSDTSSHHLSGGMKRRLLIAQALVHKPPVIVLDEPTAGVDVELRQGLWHFIRNLNQAGHTIILTTHYLEEAESLCQRLALLKQGQVVALDTTRNLLQRFASHYLKLRLPAGITIPDTLGATLLADGCYQITLNAINDLEAVLANLRLSGITPEDISLSPPDLEEAFVRIMQESTL